MGLGYMMHAKLLKGSALAHALKTMLNTCSLGPAAAGGRHRGNSGRTFLRNTELKYPTGVSSLFPPPSQ
eukprot:1160921-Pelagomonas_calceolata.AAC.17